MKKLTFIALIIFFFIKANAQSFEISVQANSGLSHYTGKRPVHSTFLNASAGTHGGYANGDGDILSPCYGVDVQWQYTFKFNFLIGTQLGYELLSNKVDINQVYAGAAGGTSATGYSDEHNGYFNFNPYLGYRFKLNKVRLDVLPGIEIAPGTNTFTTINVKAGDGAYYNKLSPYYGGAPALEVRTRLGLAAYYQRYGITASWSRGTDIRNYYADSPVPPENMEIFRLGISYRLR